MVGIGLASSINILVRDAIRFKPISMLKCAVALKGLETWLMRGLEMD